VGGRAVVPLSVAVGSWVPIERNVTWVEAYLRIKWYPGASSRLATIHIGRKEGGGAVPLSGGSWVFVLDNVCLMFITFRVSRRRREVYIGHARRCVCLSLASLPHYCTDSDVTWRMVGVCALLGGFAISARVSLP